MAFDFAQAVAKIEERLANTSETTAYPVLIMISGLPGTGKSYLARKLAERLPFVVIETDFVRKTLFLKPTYTAQESGLVHGTCHCLIHRLLNKGVRIIFDATNLIEHQREMIYHLAEKAGAKLIIVRIVAPEEVVRERLQRRKEEPASHDISDADWRIYKRMSRRQQRIGRTHLVVDTSGDIDLAVNKILRIMK